MLTRRDMFNIKEPKHLSFRSHHTNIEKLFDAFDCFSSDIYGLKQYNGVCTLYNATNRPMSRTITSMFLRIFPNKRLTLAKIYVTNRICEALINGRLGNIYVKQIHG